MFDVFVSHSTRRHTHFNHLVERLTHALQHRDLHVFWDHECLVRGERLLPTLGDAIEQSRAGLVVHSAAALESAWVEMEISKMRERHRRSLMRMVALRLEPGCRLIGLVTWDTVVEVAEPIDLTALADTVAAALRH